MNEIYETNTTPVSIQYMQLFESKIFEIHLGDKHLSDATPWPLIDFAAILKRKLSGKCGTKLGNSRSSPFDGIFLFIASVEKVQKNGFNGSIAVQ